jgi:hypothetical protein
MRLELPGRAAIAGALVLIAACSTSPREIQTPNGAVAGQVNGPFVVLGVASRATSTLSRPNGNTFVQTVRLLDVPAGTEVIVPTITGWDLGYGSTTPADLSGQTTPESTFDWNPADHHLGLARIDISVTDIDAPAPGATSQSATLRIGAQLADVNGDDPWWGVIRYQLIFLGRAPAP